MRSTSLLLREGYKEENSASYLALCEFEDGPRNGYVPRVTLFIISTEKLDCLLSTRAFLGENSGGTSY